jgi:hypothetical protein
MYCSLLAQHMGRPKKKATAGQAKVRKVMREFSHHTLHSGSKRGPTVTSRKQALAIAYSEARRRTGRKK